MIHFLNAHFHFRKRSGISSLEKYPSRKPSVRFLDNLIIVCSIIGPMFALPQVISAWNAKDISGLSVYTWVAWLILSLIWICYGIVHKEKPIIISCLLNASMQSAVIVAIIIR